MNSNKSTSKQPIPSHAKLVFKGILFDTYQWEQELYDGTTTTFEKLKRPDTVVIFPILDDGKILLIRDQQPLKESVITSPGGRVNNQEDVLEAAKRELLEETGFSAKNFTLWKQYQPTSKIDWSIYVFVAKGLIKVSEPNFDGGERISNHPVDFSDLIKLVIKPDSSLPEILNEVYNAKLDPEKMQELKDLLKP